MAYYAPPPRPDRGTTSAAFSYGYGYSTSPIPPPYPTTNANYYPPSSTKQRTTTPAANYSSYYPPPTSPMSPGAGAGATAPPPKARRRSVSFSAPAATSDLPSDLKKKEMLYQHINVGTTSRPPKSPSSSKPRRFSKTYADDFNYDYVNSSYTGKDHKYPEVFVSEDDSQDDDPVYEYNKEKLSKRFDRSASGRIAAGLRRSGTEKISSLSRGRSPSRTRTSPRGEMPSLHVPRAPRPPAPQRTTPPPPPPAPASNKSGGSDRSRRSDRATHGGTTVRGDYDFDYDYNYEYVTSTENRRGRGRDREEKKHHHEKSWMNINGNKIVVDSKGVKINGQRYDAPGGKGTFNVGGIMIRVDGGVISLV